MSKKTYFYGKDINETEMQMRHGRQIRDIAMTPDPLSLSFSL
jgi:hypothetical protein